MLPPVGSLITYIESLPTQGRAGRTILKFLLSTVFIIPMSNHCVGECGGDV